MARGPLIGQVMSFMAACSVPDRGGTLLAGERVACEAVEAEALDQRMRRVPRHGVAHRLAAHRSRLEAPRAPARNEIKYLDRRESHDGSEVRRHVGHAGPLAV